MPEQISAQTTPAPAAQQAAPEQAQQATPGQAAQQVTEQVAANVTAPPATPATPAASPESQQAAPEEQVTTLEFDGEPIEIPSDDSGEPAEEPEDELPADAPDWVKRTREVNKELKAQLREQKKQLAEIAKNAPKTPPVEQKPAEAILTAEPEKPTLEGCAWDVDAFEEKLILWQGEKQKFEAQKAAQVSKQKAVQEEYQAKVKKFEEEKQALKLPDYQVAQDAVAGKLDVVQQGMLLDVSDAPAALVYVLHKKPELLTSLASIKNPVLFVKELLKIESKMNLKQATKPAAPPAKPKAPVEQRQPETNVDSKLEALRAEADRTGNRTPVIQYLRSIKK
jgi:hypothetical protein